MPRLIPCLDVRDGRIVKGVGFRDLRDAGDPAERAALYAQEGADEIVLLDVSATLEARRTRLETVRRVRAVLPIPLTVGGGVRDMRDAEELLIAGADKIAINSAAVEDPNRIAHLAEHLGRQCVVLSVDARRCDGRYQVVTRSGTTVQPLEVEPWVTAGAELGAGEILLTSQDSDGTRRGYDLELISLVRRAVNLPVIASGGASTPEHLVEGLRAGADAVLAASMFHFDDTGTRWIKNRMAELGAQVRR